jgi:hypothetical protein
MVTAIEGPLQVEAVQESTTPGSQPAFQPEPKLDEAAVRAAVMAAEAQGKNPVGLSIADLTQGTEAQKVPDKFVTPTGEVDVEKLKASTRQLDEAIEKKEQAMQEVQKSIDDYVADYRSKEQKFRSMPNPERLAASVPPPPPPPLPQQMSDQQLQELLMRDYNANPIGTVAQLIEIAMEKKLQPLEAKQREEKVRENVGDLARKDPRVLQPQVYAAINAKLESSPELWNLKNPHKAAWLEVKEELRLGEPSPVQAQPSRPPSPILGGGTPPPTPSSSSGGPITTETVASAIYQANPRDANQMANLDKAAKEYFDREWRNHR